MSEWNKQDKEVLDGILNRIEDARLRYFFLMLGSAIADYCESQKDTGGRAAEPSRPAPN